MTIDTLLAAVGFTEPSDFGELCQGLRLQGQLPDGRQGWHAMFLAVRDAEARCYLTVVRENDRVMSLQLTTSGANFIREKLDAKRGLFAVGK